MPSAICCGVPEAAVTVAEERAGAEVPLAAGLVASGLGATTRCTGGRFACVGRSWCLPKASSETTDGLTLRWPTTPAASAASSQPAPGNVPCEDVTAGVPFSNRAADDAGCADAAGLTDGVDEALSCAEADTGQKATRLAAVALAARVEPAMEKVSLDGLWKRVRPGPDSAAPSAGERCAWLKGNVENLVGLRCRDKICLWSSADALAVTHGVSGQLLLAGVACRRDAGHGEGALLRGSHRARWVLSAIHPAA